MGKGRLQGKQRLIALVSSEATRDDVGGREIRQMARRILKLHREKGKLLHRVNVLEERSARQQAEVREGRHAVEVAKVAIWMLNEWDESMSSYQQGASDGTTARDLAALLDAITGKAAEPGVGRVD